jgi:acetyl-CoA C-acetyltransferase
MNDVYILSAARTPIGKFGGGLSTVPAPELGGVAIRAAIQRAGIAPERVDEVIMGEVLQARRPPGRRRSRAGCPTVSAPRPSTRCAAPA